MITRNTRRGFTQRCFPKGFTLIELLVVVLIIGILVAVALPQYQKVVRKAQTREVFVAIDSLSKALHTYYLENGRIRKLYSGDAPTQEELPLTIPDLKHWQYNWNGDAIYRKNLIFELSCPTGYAGVCTRFVPNGYKSDQINVLASWDKQGKLDSIECTGRIEFPTCADYFSECPQVQPTSGVQIYCGEERTFTSYEHTCKLK